MAEAFERGGARAFSLDEIVGYDRGDEPVWDSLERVEPDEHVAVTGKGKRIHYDALVVAAGAIAREPLPGALTFRGRGDVARLRGVLDELAAGTARSVALTLSSERTWPLPIYELALMTASHLREHATSAVEIWLVTPEEEPLELFGPACWGRGRAVRMDIYPASLSRCATSDPRSASVRHAMLGWLLIGPNHVRPL